MEKILEYIDAYFNRELDPGATREFEQRLTTDENFAQQVAFYLAARQASKGESIADKKQWFRQLYDNADIHAAGTPAAKVRRMWIYRAVAAAAVIILIVLAWTFFVPGKNAPAQMAGGYIDEHLTTLSVRMGGTADNIENGLRFYNEGRYDSALHLFETVLQNDTANYLAKKYTGIVYLRLAQYDKALVYFQQLEKYTRYSNPAIFFQALTIMKRDLPGDKQKARQLLQQVVERNLEEKETAQQWLKKL